MINQSVENSWQGLFPLKEGGVSRRVRESNAQCQKHNAPPTPAMLAAVREMMEEDL